MRTLVYFLFTVFASMCFMWSAIYTGKPMDLITHSAISLGLWGLFLYYFLRKQDKRRLRQQNEEMLNAYLRNRIRR